MKPIIETLRKLSEQNTARKTKAEQIADNIKKQYDAANQTRKED